MTYLSDIADGKPATAAPLVAALTDYQGIGNNLVPRDANGSPENNTRDIGTASYQWKDIRAAGTVYSSGLSASNISLGGGATTQPICQLKSSSFNVDTSDVAITFSTEDIDTASMHSTSSNSERITIPSNGIYAIAFSTYSSNAEFANTNNYGFVIRLNRNVSGSSSVYLSRASEGYDLNGKYAEVGFYVLMSLSTNDYVWVSGQRLGSAGYVTLSDSTFCVMRVA